MENKPESENQVIKSDEENKESEIQFSQIYQKEENPNQNLDSNLQKKFIFNKSFHEINRPSMRRPFN